MSGGCATCRHLIVPPDKLGRRVVRPDRGYRCGYVVEWPPLPMSITETRDWCRVSALKALGVWKGFGEDCPVWEPLP